MVKYALLIGINYTNDETYKLKASYNDVLLMQKHLINHENFEKDNVLILTDKVGHNTQLNATYDSIINRIKEMINISTENDVLFFYFTGHGCQINDINNDEIDKKDEVFVTSDYKYNKSLTDDILKTLLMQSKATIFTLFDCCNSGTMADLKYSYSLNPYSLNTKLLLEDGNKITSISSSSDNADSYEKLFKINTSSSDWFSIFTYKLIEHLTKNKETFFSLIETFKKNIEMKNCVISFSDLNMQKTNLFEVYVPIETKKTTDNDINNDNNIADRIARLEKRNKKLQKTMQNKDLLIKKFKTALQIKGSNKYNPFTDLLYSIHD
jgi:hypothetical protein